MASKEEKSTATKKKTKAKVSKKKTVKKKVAAKKVTAKKTTKKGSTKPSISPRERYEMIATMAYYRAEQRNFEPGHDVEDWLDCESIIDGMLGKSK
ncbi:MAG: DUF2934 domain-containing protein [Candidatus Thiodiazotropha sp.]